MSPLRPEFAVFPAASAVLPPSAEIPIVRPGLLYLERAEPGKLNRRSQPVCGHSARCFVVGLWTDHSADSALPLPIVTVPKGLQRRKQGPSMQPPTDNVEPICLPQSCARAYGTVGPRCGDLPTHSIRLETTGKCPVQSQKESIAHAGKHCYRLEPSIEGTVVILNEIGMSRNLQSVLDVDHRWSPERGMNPPKSAIGS